MLIPAIKYHVGVLPEKLQLKGYEWWYRLRAHRGVLPPDCARDRHYRLSAEQIYGHNRIPGVSGYYRLFNEEDFLAASVESHLPFFDELILVHDSTTTDRTPEIARALAHKYPDKVKCYFYEPAVPKPRTTAYRMLPASHPCSFANYYNFALSKTTRQIVTKLDGDHIAIDTSFAQVTDKIHSLDFMKNVFYAYVGINLWSYEDQLYVDTRRATTDVGDIGFYVMRPERSYYTKRKWTEDGYFSRKHRTLHHAGSLFFHLKNMRRRAPYQSDRGLDDTIYQERFRRRFLESQRYWIDWDTFVRRYRETFLTDMATDLAGLPDPHEYLRDRLGSLPTLTHRVLPPPPPERSGSCKASLKSRARSEGPLSICVRVAMLQGPAHVAAVP